MEARIDVLEQKLRAVEVPPAKPASAKQPARRRRANSKPAAESRRAGRSKAAPAGPAGLESFPEGARLLADQMAEAGVPEEEVKAFLRSTFDLDGGGSGSGERAD